MESHLVRIINRLEAMAKDGGNLKRNFEREGVVVAEVAYSHDEENGSAGIVPACLTKILFVSQIGFFYSPNSQRFLL